MRGFSGEELCVCAGRVWKCVLVEECLNDFLGGLIFEGGDAPSCCCWYISILVHTEYAGNTVHSQVSDLYCLFSFYVKA